MKMITQMRAFFNGDKSYQGNEHGSVRDKPRRVWLMGGVWENDQGSLPWGSETRAQSWRKWELSLSREWVHAKAKALWKNKHGAFQDKVGQHSCSTWREDKVMTDWVRRTQLDYLSRPPLRLGVLRSRGPATECEGTEAHLTLQHSSCPSSVLFPIRPAGQRWQWGSGERGTKGWKETGSPRRTTSHLQCCLSCCMSKK